MHPSVPNEKKPPRILVVDDSLVMRKHVATAVTGALEVRCDTASGASEAMRLMAEHTYALVITDVNMPEINGLELLAYIRKAPATTDMPVLLLSSDAAESDQKRALRIGASGYVIKPFQNEVLVSVVRRLLSAHL